MEKRGGVHFTMRMPVEMHDTVNLLAKADDVSLGEKVRQIIEQYLNPPPRESK